jgi:flagellar L-ring protein precursor FlgH
MMKRLSFILVVFVLAGCETDPSTRVAQPMTIRPNERPPKVYANGAIYQVSDSRPFFEDRRARFVGDTITILLAETTSANKSTNQSSARSGSAAVAIGAPTILGYTPNALPLNIPGFSKGSSLNTSFNGSSSLNFSNKDSNANNNNFTGTITVTVIDVLPNGNLQVSGEKQIAINEQTEFIRISGVVNPTYISSANTVNSTQVADARIESKTKQSIDTSQVLSMFSRFFVALLPF